MSAASTIASKLGETTSSLGITDCTISNIRFLSWVIVIICLFCLLSSLMTMTVDTQQQGLYYKPCLRQRFREYFDNMFDNFDNSTKYQEMYNKQTVKNIYRSILLTAPDTQMKSPSNLLLGNANQFIIAKDGTQLYRLEISANLPVLDGNVFASPEKYIHSYHVYLYNNDDSVTIGELKKDGTGLYKITFISDKPEDYIKYKNIKITYKTSDKETTLLQGSFE
jgi:hypothetical protein